MFLQQLFNGLSVGSIYALMAVGYSLIYSLLNFTNFAHSLTVTLGAFVAFFVTSTALQNLTVGILAAVAVAGAAAMLIQKTAYSPLLKKNVRRIYLTIAGLGTVTIGENLMIIGFTGRFRAYPVNFSSDMISIFGASVGEVDLIILYGDNVFEKDGIRRDRTGDGEKTRCLCGKRGIFNRDGPAMGPQIIRQLE